MNIPPFTDKEKHRLYCNRIEFSFDGLTIRLATVGGGGFVQIRTEGDSELCLEADEILAFSRWANAACDELDVHNEELAPQPGRAEKRVQPDFDEGGGPKI